ncbi:imelysin family protein [Myxococcus sp. K38C18041901]|uniref:imelysin family protein n=1 Tax=Myxococcus guangdongensis TaxID=2906760 RepID=UPI0020A793C9|nr:imelysin family protein [Myxococcus guangdongensis]MCP3064150.1 imelysin family protein [Myxococcus guangdongensis]
MSIPLFGLRASSAMSVRAVLLTATLCLACSDTKPKPPGPPVPGDDVRMKLLSATGECILGGARDFLPKAQALRDAAALLKDTPDAANQAASRAAFHEAMDSWQVMEAIQVGPAAPRSTPGGGEIRDHIHSFPLYSRCAIEEQLVSKGYESPSFSTSLVTRRGFLALEYLLFYEGAETACGPNSAIVANGTWAALPAEERASRKRAYAAVVAADVATRAQALVEAWSPEGGNFLKTLATAGAGNTVFPTTQVALNTMSDALFYVEREGKDQKLARPLALRDCSSDICPELLESQFAGRSKKNLRQNLVGFRKVMEGCGPDFSGTGFDDVLAAVGAEAIATRMREQVLGADAALVAIEEEDLQQALVQDKPSVQQVYAGFKGITDLLKTDFISTLDLEPPAGLEGDND